MNNNEPIIRALPNEEQFNRLVDQVIAADTRDGDIHAFIQIVLTVANTEDDYQWGLACSAVRQAFTNSTAFEQAFRAFSGYPEQSHIMADRYTIEASREV